MSWQPSTLNFSVNITPQEPEYLRIVKSSVDFCSSTYIWGLLSHTGTKVTPNTPTSSFLVETVGTGCNTNTMTSNTFIPKFSSMSDYTNSPAIKVVDKFIEFFNTPMKIIKCSDPDEYMYGIKSLCDGIFAHFVNNMGKTSNSNRYTNIVMDLINKLNSQLPFKSDDGTLASFMSGIESYMNVSYVPSFYANDYANTPGLKSAIYAAYYPYFVFLYILTFVSDDYRKNLTFVDSRKAKLACYLFVAHLSSILHKLLTSYDPYVPQEKKTEYTDKKMLLLQIMGNVSLNILGKESTEYDTNKVKWADELNQLSTHNKTMNQKLSTDNERYERYKQNLLSAANSEFAVQKQHKWSGVWMVVHIWLLVILIILISIILVIPRGKIPNNYDGLAVYIICGSSMLYALVMGMIGAVRMLK